MREAFTSDFYRDFTPGIQAECHTAPMLLRLFQWTCWSAYLAGCLLILANSLSDYLPGGSGLFIADKGELGHRAVWRISLHIHVVGGILCLFAALPQFSRKLLGRIPSIHRIAGRAYGMTVLFLVAPTGLYLALHAKGGLPGKLGFLTLGFLTFHTTLAGWRTVLPRHRDMAAHRAWMTRSFALVASAVTFRAFHTLGHLAGVDAGTNYVACLWLSLLGNLAVAECIIRSRRPSLSLPIQLQTEP
jgi:hypothetical protein